MAGVAVAITTTIDQVTGEIQDIASRFGSMQPALAIIGQTVVDSIVQNFIEGGRPAGWTPLQPATIAAKKGDGILRESGQLMGSIHYNPPSDDTVVIGTDKIYGAIHHFGGSAGRGGSATIDARPFMQVQDEDWDEIKAQLSDYLIMGKI